MAMLFLGSSQEKDERDPFEEIIEAKKKEKKVEFDTDLTVDDLKDLVALFKKLIKTRLKVSFPEDPGNNYGGNRSGF